MDTTKLREALAHWRIKISAGNDWQVRDLCLKFKKRNEKILTRSVIDMKNL